MEISPYFTCLKPLSDVFRSFGETSARYSKDSLNQKPKIKTGIFISRKQTTPSQRGEKYGRLPSTQSSKLALKQRSRVIHFLLSLILEYRCLLTLTIFYQCIHFCMVQTKSVCNESNIKLEKKLCHTISPISSYRPFRTTIGLCLDNME